MADNARKAFKVRVLGSDVEFYIPRVISDACAHRGQCDSDVRYWRNILQKKLAVLPDKWLYGHFRSYGISEGEYDYVLGEDGKFAHPLKERDRAYLVDFALWQACCQAKEEKRCWVYLASY